MDLKSFLKSNRCTATGDLKALLFDVDGTLADTERDGHRVAFNQAFADAGLGWHWGIETYGQLLKVAGGKERIRYFIERVDTNVQPAIGLEKDPGVQLDNFISALHQSKTRYFVSLLQSGLIPLRPGVERLLNKARASGLRLAIATTSRLENVTALLTATLGEESIAWFDVIAAGDVVAEKKPAPDIYLYALQQLGLKAPECLAFEDSENGLLSATRAGLKTIVTINDYSCNQDFGAAAIVLNQLDDPDFQLKTIEEIFTRLSRSE